MRMREKAIFYYAYYANPGGGVLSLQGEWERDRRIWRVRDTIKMVNDRRNTN
jgi:hypothetical protein